MSSKIEMESNQTTILVPIRYPLTDESSNTLAAAGRLAHDRGPADLRVLHVNLLQTAGDIQTTELTRAISAVLDGVDASVSTRRGFLVEEVILEEAMEINADVIVIGAKQKATWRQLLSRVVGNEAAVGSFLRANAPKTIDIVEADTTTPQTVDQRHDEKALGDKDELSVS